MGPVCDEERLGTRSDVTTVRDHLERVPDLRPERIARGRAMLAKGLPSSEELAESVIDCARRERMFH